MWCKVSRRLMIISINFGAHHYHSYITCYRSIESSFVFTKRCFVCYYYNCIVFCWHMVFSRHNNRIKLLCLWKIDCKLNIISCLVPLDKNTLYIILADVLQEINWIWIGSREVTQKQLMGLSQWWQINFATWTTHSRGFRSKF